MENKKNMCVLFSAFDFDRRFVFQLHGPEVSASAPKEKEKGDKKGEVTEKSDPKKALGELAASVKEAKERGPEKPYSVTKLKEIQVDLLRVASDIDSKKEASDVLAVLAPIIAKLRAAGDALKADHGNWKFVQWEGLMDCIRDIEHICSDNYRDTLSGDLTGIANITLPRTTIWIDPTTQQEQKIVIELIDNAITLDERLLADERHKNAQNPLRTKTYEFSFHRGIEQFRVRKTEVQAMKLPQ